MGLDMYLSRRTYVKNWDHMKPDQLHHIEVNGPRADYIKPERIKEVVEEVGYWRKANAIHRWFVVNVQDGVDDCKEYYVSREQLKELLDAVNQVLEGSELVEGTVRNGSHLVDGKWEPILEPGKVVVDPEVAHELLPTQEGFFFGGTDYDEWYIEDLKNTKEILEPILAIPDDKDDGDYYYQASW